MPRHAKRKNFPEIEELSRQIQTPIVRHIERFVRVLATGSRGSDTLEAWASAVPVALGGQPILLTAKHALDHLEDRRLFLELPNDFIPLRLTTKVESQVIDTAAIRLPASAFDWGLDFLDLDVQFEPQLAEDEVEIFIASGFPARETRPNPSTTALELKLVTHWSFEAPEAYRELELDSSLWIATRFDRERAFQHGHRRAIKLPHGMSGGVLWRFWSAKDQAPSLGQGAFAGLLVEFRRRPVKCMLSARLDAVRHVARQLLRHSV